MLFKNRFPILVFIALFGIYLASCISPVHDEGLSTSVPAPTNVWNSLLEVTPVPFAKPLPKSDQTPLDGTYAYFDPAPPQWWACLRCADYRPAGGIWRMQFDRGVMRIYYEVTGWHSLASYTISGDRLYLSNDPYCNESTGEYKWKLANGNLNLEVVDDPCSFQLRGKNLSAGTWQACSDDAGVEPRGCSDPVIDETSTSMVPVGLVVTVHEADVRLGSSPPDVLVNASGTGQIQPEETRISFSDESLLYGVNRVLWTNDDWVEVVTDAPFTSMGVQFRGEYMIGWARVLFDGQEIWRGDTSRIWSELKVHGGYIEVTGFSAGQHTIRVERLNMDSRPVVVAFFGFTR